MHPHGFLRITAACHATTVANPQANRMAVESVLKDCLDSDIVLLPELTLSGYTCGELFAQRALLEGCLRELVNLADRTKQVAPLIVVGMPLALQGRLYNVACALQSGKLLGIVPKQYLPTYQEFYEGRWFIPGDRSLPPTIEIPGLGQVPIGIDLLFVAGESVVGIEICEDLWMPIPPSSLQTLAGANVLLNLSASNETIGKAPYRTQLVASQSGRCCAAYAYASSGPGESTTDLVFGGHCIIAENGSVLSESKRVGNGLGAQVQATSTTVDVDLQRLLHDRQIMGTLHQGRSLVEKNTYRKIEFALSSDPRKLYREVTGQPFVPRASAELEHRCQEIFEIQCAALAKRVRQLPESATLHIGVSGGLDSTLALLVAVRMCQQVGWTTDRIHGLTMPGFGTSAKTLDNSHRLMKLLKVRSETIDIRAACLQVFRDLQHAPFGIALESKSVEQLQKDLESLPEHRRNDLVFENVQARVRTLMLMNRGFVLGTGDLSEQALGWSTYNGDHMSMYNVNASIPKTLVRFLVRYVAEHDFEGEIRSVLLSIADTPISPELLPLGQDRSVKQETESSIGPYELHDFFLYHFVRTGATPEKLLYLAEHANFSREYSQEEVHKTLRLFLTRFFANQFKRTCVPDGPKVGSISLSPRGDWRMPTDASVQEWIERI